MSEFMKVLFSLSLSGTLLMLLVFLLKPLYRERFSRRWQYYIWLVAALRFVLPFTPDTSVTGCLFERLETAVLPAEGESVPAIAGSAGELSGTEDIAAGGKVLSGMGRIAVRGAGLYDTGTAAASSERLFGAGFVVPGGNMAQEPSPEGAAADGAAVQRLLPEEAETAGITSEIQSFEAAADGIAGHGLLPEGTDDDRTVMQRPVSAGFRNAAAAFFALLRRGTVLFCIWLAVALFLILRRILTYRNFMHFVKDKCIPVGDSRILEVLEECRKRQGIRRNVRVYAGPLIQSPLLTGFWHPCVLLPASIVSEGEGEVSGFVHIFNHELTHYKRRDMFYKWFIQIICCIHWFNPFVGWLARETGKACELACDEAVTAGLDREGRIAYGNTLLSFLRTEGRYRGSLVSVTLTEGLQELKERLGAIMKFRKKTKAGIVFTALLTVFVFLCSATLGAYARPGGIGHGEEGVSAVSDTAQRMAYKNIRYLPEVTDLTEQCSAYGIRGLGFVNGAFYMLQGEGSPSAYYLTDCKITAYRPDTGEEKVLVDCTGTELIILTAVALEDGSVIVLFKSGEDVGDPGYRLYRVDSEGNEIFSREHPELSFSGGDRYVRLAADARGRCCLRTHDELILFGEEGELLKEIGLDGMDMTAVLYSINGKIYTHDWKIDEFVPVDFDAPGMGTETFRLPVTLNTAAGTTESGGCLICDETTVYRYDSGNGALAPLFDLQDSQISDASSIEAMGEMEDGRIFLFVRDEEKRIAERILLTPVPLAECPEKETITIGVLNPEDGLLENVAEFNRQNEDFCVSILNYCAGGREVREAAAALELDILSGNVPDLCQLDYIGYFEDSEELLAGGYFEDLSPYLENSRQYGREDFIAGALNIFTYEEQLLAIPKYFLLYTIAGSSGILGEKMGWDMEELRAVVREHPEALAIAEGSKTSLLDVCIGGRLGEFVDFDRKSADFDSPEYVELLNYLEGLPDELEGSEGLAYEDDWLKEGKALLSFRQLGSLASLQELNSVFKEGYTCIGYPTQDGTAACDIRGRGAYAVSAGSPNQERAWEFLEWNCSAQEKEKSYFPYRGFPSRRDIFEWEIEEAMIDQGYVRAKFLGDGTRVIYDGAVSGEVEQLYTMIENAKPEKAAERKIMEILQEEAAGVFEGSRTAEEAARATQKRVQAYLKER